jgi:hypothetical protein
MSTFIVRVNDGPEELSADDVADAIYSWDECQGGMERSQIDVQKVIVGDLSPSEHNESLIYRVEDVA